jgi:DNA-binding response OmpR family regulator
MVRESPPDLVVTNVCIKGVPGFDVMTLIRKEFPNVFVLMVPGLPDDEEIRQWMGEPGFDVFPKPFTSSALQERVREVLAR